MGCSAGGLPLAVRPCLSDRPRCQPGWHSACHHRAALYRVVPASLRHCHPGYGTMRRLGDVGWRSWLMPGRGLGPWPTTSARVPTAVRASSDGAGSVMRWPVTSARATSVVPLSLLIASPAEKSTVSEPCCSSAALPTSGQPGTDRRRSAGPARSASVHAPSEPASTGCSGHITRPSEAVMSPDSSGFTRWPPICSTGLCGNTRRAISASWSSSCWLHRAGRCCWLRKRSPAPDVLVLRMLATAEHSWSREEGYMAVASFEHADQARARCLLSPPTRPMGWTAD